MWRDVSEQFRAYGFAGYLGALRVQGWTVSQQPNAHTRDLVETPHIPYPSMMLAGGAADSDGWRYMAGMVSNPSADMVGMSRAAEYRIARAAVSVSDLSDLHGCLTLPGSVPDGFDVDDFSDGGEFDDEPEPVTREIAEVPPVVDDTTRVVRVSTAVIPAGIACKDLDVFKAYGRRPRAFRDSRGRRVAYVAFDATGGVIAYRDYYQPDNVADTAIADYMAAHNLIKVA
ncbi:hypothetical protein [Bifidobacterium panos]|uniref:hypothetical protein n=1 Tax=Bifidobacterium panos TaxID=2675321 RepID=UPI0015566C5F|nr:hypothetical protein [Bifidobacterium sp. DSM 109963]